MGVVGALCYQVFGSMHENGLDVATTSSHFFLYVTNSMTLAIFDRGM